MTEDEKKQKEQEYTNLCAKLGDLFLTRDLLELDLQATREKAKNIILEIKPAPNKDTAPEPDEAYDANDDETETVEPEPAPVVEAEPEPVEPAPDQLVRIENDPTDAQPTLF